MPIQNFPPYIVNYLCQYHNNFELWDHRHISINKWNLEWIQRANSMDVKAVLSYECSVLHLQLRKSLIKHPLAGLGLFTMKSVAKGACIGYYYGTLVYGDLGTNRRLLKRYGTGILSITSEDYDKWANQLGHEFTDSKNDKYDGYIVPAPFCVTRYINDGRYLGGDREKDLPETDPTKPSSSKQHETSFKKRTCNVRFVEDRRATFNKDYEKYSALQIIAIRDIEEKEELYANYGPNYDFH